MIKAYRKLLAILLTVSMSCGFVIMDVYAANDDEAASLGMNVQTEAVAEESVSPKIKKMMTVLKAFDIIPDYYDYNVPLTYDVSRSDFAAAVAKMIGKTKYDGSEVYFYDVPKNYWA